MVLVVMSFGPVGAVARSHYEFSRCWPQNLPRTLETHPIRSMSPCPPDQPRTPVLAWLSVLLPRPRGLGVRAESARLHDRWCLAVANGTDGSTQDRSAIGAAGNAMAFAMHSV